METLVIRKGRSGPLVRRHPWVFSGALKSVPEGLAPGDIVRLVDEEGAYLATGYFNSYSQIAVRVLTYDSSDRIDREFFVRRIRAALAARRMAVESPDTNAYRLINGEGDMLPGLVVDKYADVLVLQGHTMGMERLKPTIVEALNEVLSPVGIYERSNISARKHEGLKEQSGLLMGQVPDIVEIRENGFKFLVDVIAGQKTGFFLDQRDKRAALGRYARDMRVLNCFSYTGGFSVYALASGAAHVTSVDVSGPALALARENVRINGLDESRAEFIEADVKQYLRQPGRFDVVVLDPPAFIKDRKKTEQGLRGYLSINAQALGLMQPDGGVLVSCSCSAHMGIGDLRRVVTEAASQRSVSLSVIDSYTNGPDHPVAVAFEEGDYLKCLFLRVIR